MCIKLYSYVVYHLIIYMSYIKIVDTKTMWFCGDLIQKLENQNLAPKLTQGFLLLSPSSREAIRSSSS